VGTDLTAKILPAVQLTFDPQKVALGWKILTTATHVWMRFFILHILILRSKIEFEHLLSEYIRVDQKNSFSRQINHICKFTYQRKTKEKVNGLIILERSRGVLIVFCIIVRLD